MKWVAIGIVLAATAASAEPTRVYTTVKGDTCAAIAIRELGDRQAVDEIHRLNPWLGPLPHNLKVGTQLVLPLPGADAKLSRANGAVVVRKPDGDAWDPAQLGMDLFRAWRVNAKPKSSADLVFKDTSELHVRENTILVVLGATKDKAKITEAELETGGLEARLGGSARRVVVRSPSSESTLAGGHTLVTVDGAGASIVANHGGAPVAVRQIDRKKKQAIGAGVQVATGYGSRVIVDKPPETPRPLPATPHLAAGARRFIDLGTGATIALAWDAVATATHYRVELSKADGGSLGVLDLPAPRAELHGVPAGAYTVRVAAIDADGFESIPTGDEPAKVEAGHVFAPGASSPIEIAAAQSGDLGVAPPAIAVPVGGRVVAPGCDPIALPAAGTREITCGDAGPLSLSVVGVEVATVDRSHAAIARDADAHIAIALRSSVALGEKLEVHGSAELQVVSISRTQTGLDVVVRVAPTAGPRGKLTVAAGDVTLGSVDVDIAERVVATAAPLTAPMRWELGAAIGGRYYTDNADVGHPKDIGHELHDAATLDVLVSRAITPRFGVELAAGVSSAGRREASGRVSVLNARAHLLATMAENEIVTLRVVAGGGGELQASSTDATDHVPTWLGEIGLRAIHHFGRYDGWLEAMDAIAPDVSGSVIQELAIGLGVGRPW